MPIGCDSQKVPTQATPEAAAVTDPVSTQTNAATENRKETGKTVNDEGIATDAETSDVPKPTVQQPISPPLTVYRPDDNRPQFDDALLAQVGIHKYESKRLILYTDIAAEKAKELPPIVDELYDSLVKYFGPLLPSRDDSPFQMTGYVIVDEELFRQHGLLPAKLPPFFHGRHSGQQFWMYEQDSDYYRRHLLLHEATHCFMTIGLNPYPPVWYLEGMAELFATHRSNDSGKWDFAIMPEVDEGLSGWGNIRRIQQLLEAGEQKTLSQVMQLQPNAFLKKDAYAWSWALCKWLASHPKYRPEFQTLSQKIHEESFSKLFERHFSRDMKLIDWEWTRYINGLERGYDFQRSAISFSSINSQIDNRLPHTIEIQSDQSWQYSGIMVEAGQSYQIAATGRVTLDTEPKPWVSEPSGISISYAHGYPIGRLLGTIMQTPDEKKSVEKNTALSWEMISLGKESRFKATASGLLFLRINDHSSRLADNKGSYNVVVNKSVVEDNSSVEAK